MKPGLPRSRRKSALRWRRPFSLLKKAPCPRRKKSWTTSTLAKWSMHRQKERAMRTLTFAGALNEALAQEMRRDPKIFMAGEDIGQYGGIYGVTKGLLDEFGEKRVRD